jgi:phosphate transport system substrate-binding protein
MTRFPHFLPLLLMMAVALGLLAGCGGGADGDDAGDELSGAVRVDGSSTVFPITEAVAEEFMQEEPRVRVTVGVSGTGGGFAKFLRGETDINDASRPIKPSELEVAEANDIEFIELPVAYDGIAIVTNPANDWVDCLTTEELERIWGPGSEIDNWSQVREGFPDREIALYGPGTASGTYDYFTEAIAGESGASRSDFSASEDDNVLVQGVAGDPNALGFFGLAYYEENADQLELLGVDDGDPTNGEGCVQPTAETVGSGTYQPLARPEFIYVNAERADDPAVSAFVEFYLQNAPELVREVGYVPLSAEAYNLALERFRNRTTGTMFDENATPGVTMEERLRGANVEAMPADTTGAMPADTTAQPAM